MSNEAPPPRPLACLEILGGFGRTDQCVLLPGMRGECWSVPHAGSAEGGDIHFVSVCGENTLARLVVADVSGHGPAVAATADILKSAIAKNINEHDNVGFLSSVNEAFLARPGDQTEFGTMVSAIFDRSQKSLTYAYAGHPPLLRGRRRDGRFVPVAAETGRRSGLPVGVLDRTSYTEHRVALESGDVVVLYTDALTEALTEDGGRLEQAGLIALLEHAASLEPSRLRRHLEDSLRGRITDDLTALILEVM